MTIEITPAHKLKIVKRYGVNGGNRFARVQCACGALTDVRVRRGDIGGEETRAAVIKAEAERVLTHWARA